MKGKTAQNNYYTKGGMNDCARPNISQYFLILHRAKKILPRHDVKPAAGLGLCCLFALRESHCRPNNKTAANLRPLLIMYSSAGGLSYAFTCWSSRPPLISIFILLFLFGSAALCLGSMNKIKIPFSFMRPYWGIKRPALRGLNSNGSPLCVRLPLFAIDYAIFLFGQRSKMDIERYACSGRASPPYSRLPFRAMPCARAAGRLLDIGR